MATNPTQPTKPKQKKPTTGDYAMALHRVLLDLLVHKGVLTKQEVSVFYGAEAEIQAVKGGHGPAFSDLLQRISDHYQP